MAYTQRHNYDATVAAINRRRPIALFVAKNARRSPDASDSKSATVQAHIDGSRRLPRERC